MSQGASSTILNQNTPEFSIDDSLSQGQFLVYDETLQAFINTSELSFTVTPGNIQNNSIGLSKLDVNGTPTLGYVLTVGPNNTLMYAPISPTGAPVGLQDLYDVVINNLIANQILQYNGTSWDNTSLSIASLTDINLSQVQNNDYLRWDQASNKWVNSVINYSVLTNKPDLTIYAEKADLADVATSGDFQDLINAPVYVSEFTGLTDVDNVVVPNGFLKWNSTGNKVVYSATIPSTSVSGLSTVASSGLYNDLLGKPDFSNLVTTDNLADVALSGSYNDLINKPSTFAPSAHTHPAGQITGLASVATTGSFNDLINKPTVYAPDVHGHSISEISGLQAELDSKITVDLSNPQIGDIIKWDGAAWVNGKQDYDDLINAPDLSLYTIDSTLASVAKTGAYSDLSGKPTIPANLVDLADVSGTPTIGQYLGWNGTNWVPVSAPGLEWNDIQNKPTTFTPAAHVHPISEITGLQSALAAKQDASTAFSGDYNDLTNQPELKDIPGVSTPVANGYFKWNGAADLVQYDTTIPVSDVTGLSDVAVSGLYDDLSNKPNLSAVALSGNYSDLVGTPTVPVNSSFSFIGLSDTNNTPVATGFLRWNTAGTEIEYVDYISVSSVIGLSTVATTGDYADLSGTPTLSTVAGTGDYNDLDNIPTAFTPVAHVHPISEITGLQSALDAKQDASTAFSGDYNDLSNTPFIPTSFNQLTDTPTNNSYSFVGLNDTNDSVVNNGYLRWNSTGTQILYFSTIPVTDITGLATVATSGDYNDLLNAPDLTDFVLSSSLAAVATTGNYNDLTNKPSLSQYALDSTISVVGKTGSWNDLLNKPSTFVPSAHLHNVSQISGLATVATSGSYADLTNKPVLSSVATSGNYNDLSNRPTIPTNSTFTLVGLSDTAATPIANGYLKWNASGNQVVYSVGIDASDVSGLSLVGQTGNYNDLINKPTLSAVAATGSYSDLLGLPTIPTNASFTFVGLSDTASVPVTNGYVKWNNLGTALEYVTTLPAGVITGLANVATSGSYADLLNKPTLAPVATSGNYTDLTNKPSIPTELNNLSDVRMRDITNTYLAHDGDVLTYNQLLGKWIPAVNASASFIGLTDTANVTDPNDRSNRYLRWNTGGTTIIYEENISASEIAGLADVATTGDLHDLLNVNVNVSQINTQPSNAKWGLVYNAVSKKWENFDLTSIVGNSSGGAQNLSDLLDVTISYPLQDGQFLRASLQPDSTFKWVNSKITYSQIDGVPVLRFTQLQDTNPNAIPNGFLRWNSFGNTINYVSTISTNDIVGLTTVATTGNYNDLTNKPFIPTNLNALTDVDTVTSTPVNGYVLTYDTTVNQWVPKAPTGSNSGAQYLNELIDVDTSGSNAGYSLVFNGSIWVANQIQYSNIANTPSLATVATTGDYNDLLNRPSNGSYSIVGLTDVSDTAVANGFLRWNATGTEVVFVNSIPSSAISGLATVASTGNYSDLINKPTNGSYNFRNLGDAGTPQPRGFVRYPNYTLQPGQTLDDLNLSLQYVQLINANTDIQGLSAVATDGRLRMLTDVDITTNPLLNGQVLMYDLPANKWYNKTINVSSSATSWSLISTSQLVSSGSAYLVDTSGGTVTLTFPANPAANDVIRIADLKGTFRFFPLRVNTNGKPLMSDPSENELMISNNNASIEMTFINDTVGWRITDGIGETIGTAVSKTAWRYIPAGLTPDNYILSSGDAIFADTETAPIFFKLPTSPAVNDVVKIHDITGSFSYNRCSIQSDDRPVMGVNQDLFVFGPYATIELTYADPITGWTVTQGINDIAYVPKFAGTATIHVDLSLGNDATGNGTLDNPYSTLDRVNRLLASAVIAEDADVTVLIHGNQVLNTPLVINTSHGKNIKYVGVETPIVKNITGIGYINSSGSVYTVSLNINSTSNLNVNDVIYITGATGSNSSSNYDMINGVWRIASIGTNSLTINIPWTGSIDVNSLNGLNAGTLSRPRNIISCETIDALVINSDLKLLDNVAIVSNNDTTNTALAIRGRVNLGSSVQIYGFGTGISVSKGAYVMAEDVIIGNCVTSITATQNSTVDASYSILKKSTTLMYAENSSHINAFGTSCAFAETGAQAVMNSGIVFTNSKISHTTTATLSASLNSVIDAYSDTSLHSSNAGGVKASLASLIHIKDVGTGNISGSIVYTADATSHIGN